MFEVMQQLTDRVKETGETIESLVLAGGIHTAVLKDDTGEKLTIDYNFEEGIWE